MQINTNSRQVATKYEQLTLFDVAAFTANAKVGTQAAVEGLDAVASDELTGGQA